MENCSLSDLAAVTNNEGWGGNNIVTLLLLFALIGNGGIFGARGDYSQFATAASQQDILFGQKFSDLDNKMDRGFTSLGNGISSATFSLNNSIKDGTYATSSAVVSEGRGIQAQLSDQNLMTQKNVDSLRFDMANYHADTNAVTVAQTQKILDVMAQNKIDSLQSQVGTLQNQLALQQAMCGVPKINPYMYGIVPTYSGCGCSCGNI